MQFIYVFNSKLQYTTFIIPIRTHKQHELRKRYKKHSPRAFPNGPNVGYALATPPRTISSTA